MRPLIEAIDRVERAYQPELQTLKEQLKNGILGLAAMLALPVLSGYLTADSIRSPAGVASVLLTASFVCVVGWRSWEFVKYEMEPDGS